jgi:hypothetical protein
LNHEEHEEHEEKRFELSFFFFVFLGFFPSFLRVLRVLRGSIFSFVLSFSSQSCPSMHCANDLFPSTDADFAAADRI